MYMWTDVHRALFYLVPFDWLQYLHKCSHEAINRKKTMLANIQVMTIYIYYIADDDIDNFLPHGVHSQKKSWTRDP